jgi:hypothetical protein
LRVVPPATEVNEVRCYTLPEAAELTHLSESFLRGEIAAGKLPVASFGDGAKRPLRVRHPDLRAYLEAHVGR